MRFNRLILEMSVTDFEESLRFYTKAPGFKVEYSRLEDGFAFLSLHGSQLMVEEINRNWETGELKRPFGRGVNLQIMVDGVEELLRRLGEHGVPAFPSAEGELVQGRRSGLRAERVPGAGPGRLPAEIRSGPR